MKTKFCEAENVKSAFKRDIPAKSLRILHFCHLSPFISYILKESQKVHLYIVNSTKYWVLGRCSYMLKREILLFFLIKKSTHFEMMLEFEGLLAEITPELSQVRIRVM